MAAETVTLDRQAVLDLVQEAHAVADVFEAITGVAPTTLTEQLQRRAEVIAEAVLGPLPPNLDEGPRFELWRAADKDAVGFFRGLAEESDDA